MASTQPSVVPSFKSSPERRESTATLGHVARSASTARPEPFVLEDGIPRSWVIAVIRAFPGNRNVPKLMILLLEGLRRPLFDPDDFTIRDLQIARDVLGVKLTDSGLRTSMAETEGLFWNLNTKIKSCSNTEITSRGGRPEQHFTALPLGEIKDNLLRWVKPRIVEERHRQWKTVPKWTEDMISVLDGDARRAAQTILPLLREPDRESSKTGYFAHEEIAALAIALNDPECTPIALNCADVRAALFAVDIGTDEAKSYRDIHRDYAVSVGGVKAFVERAGFKVLPQAALSPITSAAELEQQVDAARKETHGYPWALIVTNASGESEERPYNAACPDAYRSFVKSALLAGSTVQLELKTASKYVPADEEPTSQSRRAGGGYRRDRSDRVRGSRHYGEGFDPSMVRYWLRQELRRKKWEERAGDVFIHPETGEKYNLSG